MEVEWIKVRIDETAPRSRPMDWVLIRWPLPEDQGAVVRVLHENVDGEISLEDMKRLEDYGKRRKVNVYSDDIGRMLWAIEDTKRMIAEHEEKKKAEQFMEWIEKPSKTSE